MTSSTAEASGDGWALLLDFDGTLVDIAERPEAVSVAPGLPGTLRLLRQRLGGALAIVTGRTIAVLDSFLPGFDACGLHGLERRLGGCRLDVAGLPDLEPEIAGLRARLARHPGVVVESKRVGVAIHWRLALDAAAEAAEAASDLARRLGPGYRIQDGKAVREIVPIGAGKGGAIRALMSEPPYRGRRPAFVGDDRTDEHGFAAVNEMGGLSVKVGPGETAASHRLADPAALRAWLAAWTDRPPPSTIDVEDVGRTSA